MNWHKYHAYRVFDEFIRTFIIERRSYITRHQQQLNFQSGLSDIKTRFVDNFDASADEFETKVARQFEGAPENSKIMFVNAEYLWAMPSHGIRPETKQEYPRRWFDDAELQSGERFYFGGDHTVAGTGSYYTRNKHLEISAIIQLLFHLQQAPVPNSIGAVKAKIERFVYNALYGTEPTDNDFRIANKCSIRNMLLHLSNPDKYESIVSYSDKDRIVQVFGHVLTDSQDRDLETTIKAIRSEIYADYGNRSDPVRKERWFFYQDDILPLWKGKSEKQCYATSVTLEIQAEENAGELEGEVIEVTGRTVRRSSTLVRDAKRRDRYRCKACSFHYQNEIVQAHHLDPLAEREEPRLTTLEDLITLCPNCHYLAHHLLRRSDMYKKKVALLNRLKDLAKPNT